MGSVFPGLKVLSPDLSLSLTEGSKNAWVKSSQGWAELLLGLCDDGCWQLTLSVSQSPKLYILMLEPKRHGHTDWLYSVDGLCQADLPLEGVAHGNLKWRQNGPLLCWWFTLCIWCEEIQSIPDIKKYDCKYAKKNFYLLFSDYMHQIILWSEMKAVLFCICLIGHYEHLNYKLFPHSIAHSHYKTALVLWMSALKSLVPPVPFSKQSWRDERASWWCKRHFYWSN